MSSVEYRTILRYRLMIPLFHIDEMCLFVVIHVWILLGSMQFIVRINARPADVMVYGLVEGKHACVDLIGVSPLMYLGVGAVTVGKATVKFFVKQSGQT